MKLTLHNPQQAPVALQAAYRDHIKGLLLNGYPVEVKVRSTRPPSSGVVHLNGDDVFVTLYAGEYGISPGQACVFYADESDTTEVLGGGFIAEAVPQALVA